MEAILYGVSPAPFYTAMHDGKGKMSALYILTKSSSSVIPKNQTLHFVSIVYLFILHLCTHEMKKKNSYWCKYAIKNKTITHFIFK